MEEYMDELKNRPIGALLRDIRESRIWSLQAVAMRLKIDKRQIQALEEEEYGIFPAHVYARGVFERYAALLGLDPSEALRLFEYSWQTHAVNAEITNHRQTTVTDAPRWKTAFKLPSSFPIMISMGIGGVLLIGFAGFFMFRQIPAFSLDEPADKTVTHDHYVTVKGRADARIELTLNKQPVYIGDTGEFQREVLLQKGVNELVLEGKTALGKSSTITHYVIVE